MSDLDLIDQMKLTLSEVRVLLSLSDAPLGFRDVASLRRASNRETTLLTDESVRVHIHRLRAKVAHHGIQILTRSGGYALPDASIAIVRSIVDRAAHNDSSSAVER